MGERREIDGNGNIDRTTDEKLLLLFFQLQGAVRPTTQRGKIKKKYKKK